MTKHHELVNLQKKESIGLTVSEGKSMTIMEGNTAAGRHGTGAIAESLYSETTAMRQRENWE